MFRFFLFLCSGVKPSVCRNNEATWQFFGRNFAMLFVFRWLLFLLSKTVTHIESISWFVFTEHWPLSGFYLELSLSLTLHSLYISLKHWTDCNARCRAFQIANGCGPTKVRRRRCLDATISKMNSTWHWNTFLCTLWAFVHRAIFFCFRSYDEYVGYVETRKCNDDKFDAIAKEREETKNEFHSRKRWNHFEYSHFKWYFM